MKKILVTLRDITETGGGERVCANLTNALSEFYKIEILSFYQKSNSPTYELATNINIRYLSQGEQRAANSFVRFFRKTIKRFFLSLRTSAIIKRSNPDIVFCNDGTFMPIFKPKGPKYIRLWHLQAPKKNKKAFCKFDSIVVLSTKEIATWNNYHSNVKVIPNFLQHLPSETTDYRQKVVIAVGRIDRGDQKGFFRLLDIWEQVMKNASLNDWRLHIVGSGELTNDLQAKINAKNLQTSVIIKPFTKNIADEYLQASIYAMTSKFEGFGLVLAESASYGLAGIAFDINAGPSDIINENVTGFLVEDNDNNDYSTKLQALMQNIDLRQQFGKMAKNYVSEKYAKQQIVHKWVNLFEK